VKLFMTKLFLVGLSVFCFCAPITTFADTVDVCTVKINGKALLVQIKLTFFISSIQ
jgi:hypothetical protein